MDQEVSKDESIRATLDLLSERLGRSAFDIVDHWDADLDAVGIARPSDHRYLVYFSASHSDGTYYVELEAPPEVGSEFPYSVAGRFESVELDSLVELAKRHLALPPTDMA